MSLSVVVSQRSRLEISRSIRAMQKDAEAQTIKWVKRRAAGAERKAKRRAPQPPTPEGQEYQRTGRLVRGIHSVITEGGLGYELKSEAKYSIFVEFSKRGTKFIRPVWKSERRLANRQGQLIYLRAVKKHTKG